MQPEFMRNVLALPLPAQRVLEREFRLPRKGSLFFRLSDAEVDHSQAVLTLLASNHRAAAEILMGHPITVCPPCLSRRFAEMQRVRTPDEDKIITYLGANPGILVRRSAERLETVADRFNKLKVGMTIDQALRRGVTRRDLREWVAAKVIKIGRKALAKAS